MSIGSLGENGQVADVENVLIENVVMVGPNLGLGFGVAPQDCFRTILYMQHVSKVMRVEMAWHGSTMSIP